MKIYLVSFANKEFYEKQKILNKSALKFGIDKTFTYTDNMLKKTSFYKKNKKILDQEKSPGYGYAIWKPYVIYETLKRLNKGDILFYVDAGAEIISDIDPLVKLCKKQKGILLFNAINKNKLYTKMDCFIHMDCKYESYFEHLQFMGGYQIYEKNRRTIEFIKKVLKFVQYPFLVDDTPSKSKNFKGFITHRHDQSVLTNVAIGYGIKGFRNPSQGGNHLKKKEFRKKGEFLLKPYTYSDTPDESSDYPTIFYNKRNASKFKLFLIKTHSKLPIKIKKLIRR